MLRVSSLYYFLAHWSIAGPLTFGAAVMAVLIATGIFDVALNGMWAHIAAATLAGSIGIAFLFYYVWREVPFLLNLRARVCIDAGGRCVQVREWRKARLFPLSELTRVKLHMFPRLCYVELTFSQGEVNYFFPDYIGWLQIKDLGIASLWQYKVTEAEQYIPVPPPVSENEHDQGDHVIV